MPADAVADAPLILPAGELRVLHGAIDFRCDAHDDSDVLMKANSPDPNCCCRIRCTGTLKTRKPCARAERICSKLAECFAVDQGAGGPEAMWATLKARPRWWLEAPGAEQCLALNKKASDGTLLGSTSLASKEYVQQWRSGRCDDLTRGAPFTVPRHRNLVIDVGFHTGEDSMHYALRGYDVLAVEANAALAHAGVQRPLLALAVRAGQLRVLNVGIAKAGSNASATFYASISSRMSERSSFIRPPARDMGQFRAVEMPTLTCAAVIEQQDSSSLPPYYMKVDIEGQAPAAKLKRQLGRRRA